MRPTTSATLCAIALLLTPTATAQEAPFAPGSPESTALLDKACAKMLALGRGTFQTTEEQENAIARQMARGAGGGDLEIQGGWHGDTTWGQIGADNERAVRYRGRTVVKTGDGWALRRDKLASGTPIPFLFDPDVFFQVLRNLPAEARRVRAVETTRLKDREVVVLALTMEGDDAHEFAEAPALPPVSSVMGRIVLRGGMGGRVQMPKPDVTVDIGLYIDPDSGDVLRLRAKVYEKGGMPGGIRVAFGGAGTAVEIAGDEQQGEQAPADGKLVYKKGLPERKMSDQESMVYFRADFDELGLATPPELDDAAKKLLGAR